MHCAGTGTGLLAMMAGRHLRSAQPATLSPEPISPMEAPVVACEVFPPMAHIASKVVSHNGLQDWVRVVPKRSDELLVDDPPASLTGGGWASGLGGVEPGLPEKGASQPSVASRRRAALAAAAAASRRGVTLPERVDVIVTEIFDSQLLGEGLLPTLRDAVPRLLKASGCLLGVYGTLG